MKNDYYVYMYYDPDTSEPFYIGKGCKNRYRDISQKQRNSWLYNKIQKLRHSGLLVKDFTTFIQEKLSETNALLLEQKFIKKYGRRDIGTGILLNMSNGGDGMTGHRKKRKPTLYEHKENIFKMYKNGSTLKDIAVKYDSTITVVRHLFKFYDIKRRSGGAKTPDINWNNVISD